jgi:hypothetical protein
MKSTSIALTCAALLVISGCGGADHQSHGSKFVSGPPAGGKEVHRRLESIDYDWESYGIEVSFYREARDSSWIMTVRDAWDVWDQVTKGEEKVWGPSVCKCSTEELLRIIDRSLVDFKGEKPDAKLDSLALEMQISKDLWTEMLDGLGRRLSKLDGKMGVGRIDLPDEVDEEIRCIVDKSPTTAAIKTILGKHGIRAEGIGITGPILFKDSLSGHKWSDIATLPGLGILVPGMVEFGPE